MNHIGTLSEKPIHAQLKHYFQCDEQFHEVTVGRYIADICVDKTIIEIQTSQLCKLQNKLKYYLEHDYTITIVYPVTTLNQLNWCSLDGEIVSSRNYTKKLATYNILHELSGITQFVDSPHVTIKVICLSCKEVRMLDGYGKDKKNRPTKVAKVIDCVLDEITICNKSDLLNLLPSDLETFTAKTLSKPIGLKSRKLYRAISVLEELNLTERAGKEKRAQIWNVLR